ncbi:uncharacterized protein LOC110975889 [Acanthaster planci]|uniref:Uncharacterized protein LOC110975889 n=1 Tax=Acanthaster planci TaxID=133434 RepID=A0A8B7XXB5_ACAPL|nr:uncharacterized protein LOC110975889 [Acanthaster planci]
MHDIFGVYSRTLPKVCLNIRATTRNTFNVACTSGKVSIAHVTTGRSRRVLKVERSEVISQLDFKMELKTSLSVCFALCVLLLSFPASDGCCRDHDPPVLVPGTCPSSITVCPDPHSSGKVVRWAEPRATDKSHPIRIDREDSCPPNGGLFTVHGSPYHIVYSATDSKENKRNPLCSFTITVRYDLHCKHK